MKLSDGTKWFGKESVYISRDNGFSFVNEVLADSVMFVKEIPAASAKVEGIVNFFLLCVDKDDGDYDFFYWSSPSSPNRPIFPVKVFSTYDVAYQHSLNQAMKKLEDFLNSDR